MKKWLLSLIAALLLFSLAACGNQDQTNESNKKEEGQEELVQDGFPLTLKDARDKEVTLEKEPKQIISLMPSNTEILFELGLNEEIAGVTNFDNYPEEATKKEKVGDMNVNTEKVISLNPDLVLAHASSMGASPEAFQQIENAGIPLFVVKDATNFESVYETISNIGTLTGQIEEADQLIKAMKDEVEAISVKGQAIAKEDQKSVWVEVSPAPDIYTTGKGTFMDEMLSLIGAKNVADSEDGWVQISEEKAVQFNPDVIITTYGYYTENATEQVMNRPAWKDVTAVKEKAVVDVNSDTVTRSGPRLVEGLQELAKAVYPEVYK
ncbi:ABC transporter substrate-binding protein [Metabacillus iocasae]|uniref:Iron complex transport system substrate-binding protein n=1 Tax=Priestia iocasae TaxID=2291674 RepID=A0ABS2QRB0_9BACI|nr:ABC transporter substrate-binding protein [Metabacillus iocasae]MBM7701987.1 iron complex transport system substrate-binding protein [Metabacillus iocasae]